MTIAPEKNCLPISKLNLTQTLTLARGQFSSGALVWLPATLKLTLTLIIVEIAARIMSSAGIPLISHEHDCLQDPNLYQMICKSFLQLYWKK